MVITSVGSAFARFRREHVDLDAGAVDKARKSRDYLQQQIVSLAANARDFPRLEPDSPPFVASGSFARSTKIRPLDDIDLFVILDDEGLSQRPSFWDERLYYLTPKRSTNSRLAKLTDDSGHVSSTRVLNRFKSALTSVPNYASAGIHRNGEAVSLKLSSYPWVFDIVPAIPHFSWWTGRVDWYLMPNGQGGWMRSNPRRDAESTTGVNKSHSGLLLPLVRLVKYWNGKRLRQGLSSYYIETLCLKVFEYRSNVTTFQEGMEVFFRKAPSRVRRHCPDPKGLGPRLDLDIGRRTKERIEESMYEAATTARAARRAERAGNVAGALEAWRQVFGPEFPG